MTRSRQLSLGRAFLKVQLQAEGLKKLMLPDLGEGTVWIPLGLVAKRQPSPVRVTHKGVAKHDRRYANAKTVHKAVTKSPAPWHTRPTQKYWHDL